MIKLFVRHRICNLSRFSKIGVIYMFYNIENSNKGYFVHYAVRSAMKRPATYLNVRPYFPDDLKVKA